MSDGQNKNAYQTELTAKIVAAFVSRNSLPITEIPTLINSVYTSLGNVGRTAEPVAEELKPAVPIKRSVTPDAVICLECGFKGKMLKRHIRSDHGMGPEEYRSRWGLPPEYPMVAPNYAANRSELAKQIGLGRNGRGRPRKDAAPAAAPAAAKPGRRAKAA